jgi:FkbM family methyltransferase
MIEDALLQKYEAAKSSGAFVYGMGTFAKYVESILEILQVPVLGFLDYKSVSMNPKSAIRKGNTEDKQIVFLGFHNYAADVSNICNKLLSDGYRIINIVELAKISGEKSISVENYWLSNKFDIYQTGAESIKIASTLFHDAKSQSLFDNIIEYRKTGDLDFLNFKDNFCNQYFPNDLPWLTRFQRKGEGISVLDGGAFQGETFLIARELIKIKEWVFIEPDSRNFDILVKATSHLSEKKIFLETALYSTKMELNFNSTANTLGSYLSETGGHKVVTSTIDEIYDYGNLELDFIKLDVEGSELEALYGGQQTINSRKPFLAISTYHTPTDHWEIPMYIRNTFPFYDLYIRLHGEQTFDTVLYCVPER